VGKAKNLKKRLFSYRRIGKLLPKTKRLVEETSKTKFHECESELEALLLEAELIRLYQPQFNLRLKDDKTPLYIVVTNEEFPRVMVTHKSKIKIGGKKSKLVFRSKTIEVKSLFGPYSSGKKVRQLIRITRRLFPFCNKGYVKSDRACFYYHIDLCPGVCVKKIERDNYEEIIKNLSMFLRGKKNRLTRKLTRKIKHLSELERFEEAEKQKRILKSFLYVTKNYQGDRYTSILPNLSSDVHEYRILLLKKLLRKHIALPQGYRLHRIEAYDVSNISGKSATASMVVFEDGKPAKHEYRRFRIKGKEEPDDVGMLREALNRRVKRNDWKKPNLMVIDGGRGQLRAAREVVSWSIPVVSLAKNPERLMIIKKGIKKINYETARLVEGEPMAQLLMQLRDESHRFAKKYHELLRNKSIVED